jgi:poly-beta-1,6-N-acetyl-D-glucosamine synthase
MDAFTVLRTITIIFASLMLFKYVLFLILAPFYQVKELSRKYRLAKKDKDRYLYYFPKISVIVPAWNEEVGVLRTIKSVLDNSYHKIELIVINDGSTDHTGQLVGKFIRHYRRSNLDLDKTVSYYRKGKGGKGSALNYGIAKATGEIILTVDADSVLAPNAVANLVEYFKDPEISGVVGNVRIAENYTFLGLIQRLEYLFGFYFKRTHAVMNAEYIFGGACAAYRREVFQLYGKFDENNKTEDIEMSMRLKYNGLNCTYAEDVLCYTEGADSFGGLFNQRLRWKKGRLDTFIKYRNLFFSSSKKHNKFLSWFVLPYALLQELQLMVEPVSMALLFLYSFVSGDFVSLTFGFLFIFLIYLITSFDNREGFKPEIILLFPATWILFYMLVWVEFMALIKGVYMILRGQGVTWQEWQRKGVIEVS